MVFQGDQASRRRIKIIGRNHTPIRERSIRNAITLEIKMMHVTTTAATRSAVLFTILNPSGFFLDASFYTFLYVAEYNNSFRRLCIAILTFKALISSR
jgi:hypothetical protein